MIPTRCPSCGKEVRIRAEAELRWNGMSRVELRGYRVISPSLGCALFAIQTTSGVADSISRK